jgi:hypothetical protein
MKTSRTIDRAFSIRRLTSVLVSVTTGATGSRDRVYTSGLPQFDIPPSHQEPCTSTVDEVAEWFFRTR